MPALKGLKRSAAASTRHSGHSHLLLSAFEAAVCPPSKAQNAPRHLRPGTQATAVCYYRRSRLSFARPQRPKTLRRSFDQCQALRPQPSATALKSLKRSAAASTRHAGRLARPQRRQTLRGSFDRQLRPGTQATVVCYYRRSRLPFARPQRPKTLRGSHLLLSAFAAAVCPPSKA